ncbi:hypothetical protein L207DRAFT_505562 [Hyaloscypha variabilis F]|uniref:Uncharacterized protein n=1 Tax=Hyaloscypha variabilis (strain UAMH 11265 / GT02V1 / F) TaxID=1149755 RepID=A0A2J6SCR5_HYAVF|nr:hypothetical protein L207DRAFT_505562 [Hyaloscypha variabilis F]
MASAFAVAHQVVAIGLRPGVRTDHTEPQVLGAAMPLACGDDQRYILSRLPAHALFSPSSSPSLNCLLQLTLVLIALIPRNCSMYTSLFALAGFLAFVFASPEPVTTPNPTLSSILAQIASLEGDIIPPASILSEVITAIPATVTAVLANPSEISVLESEILASGFPGWYSSLPPDAQSWVIAIAGVAATIIPELASLQNAAASITGGSTTATTSPTTGLPSTSTGTKASTSLAPATKTSNPTAQSSSSTAGAAPTNVVAAGILGAVGFLGLVAAL